MIKKIAICLFGLAGLFTLAGCNEKSDPTEIEFVYSSTQVNSFSLNANSKVLNNLDSVFFSINLVDATIFNADSLPYGTKINRLLVTLTTDACSTIELHIPRPGQSDTVVNYRTNPNDSIDFSNGPVKLHLVSYDKTAERDYTISVNVHKLVPDSLTWNRMAHRNLPTALSGGLTGQKTVKRGDNIVCLTQTANAYSISTSDNIFENKWQSSIINPGFTPIVSSFAATDEAFYLLSDDNCLYTTDGDYNSWQQVATGWTHIYGTYGSMILGVADIDGTLCHVTYPAGKVTPVPADCPVEATSDLAQIDSRWANTTQVLMAGGKLADGSATNAIWGFDGNTWALIGNSLPKKLSNVALFNYTVTKTDTVSWRVQRNEVLIAMLGADNSNNPDSKVYVSRDNGINWKVGDQLLQLPSFFPIISGCQVLVVDTRMPLTRSDSSDNTAWREYPSAPLPRWWSYQMPISRAVTPIESWDVPYIYLLGGRDLSGAFYNSIWRGVINSLSFKPLQ